MNTKVKPKKQILKKIKQHGFWFVDIPRTSSSSIRSELGKHLGVVYGKRNIIESEHRTPQIIVDHISASRFREYLGHELWDEIYTFSLVRNPWDRTLSHYLYRVKITEIVDLSFRDYVIKLNSAQADTPLFRFHGTRFGAYDFLYDESDNLLVDYVGKFETRAQDLKIISEKIGVTSLGKLHLQSAKPTHLHYSDAYDEETKEIIYNLYRKDIDAFDYHFEEK